MLFMHVLKGGIIVQIYPVFIFGYEIIFYLHVGQGYTGLIMCHLVGRLVMHM